MLLRRISTVLALLTCTLCTSSPLIAQWSMPVPPNTPVEGVRYELEGSGPPPPTATFTRSETLDFDGDCFKDVAILVGDEIRVLFAPGLYEVLNEGILFGVKDFCALEGAGTETGDVLLCVGDGGSTIVSWGAEGWQTRSVSTVPARHVARMDKDGDARRVCIVTGAGYLVHMLVEDADARMLPWSSTPLYVSPDPISELLYGDVHGSSSAEICMMVPDGVRAVDASSQVVLEQLFPIQTVSMDLVGVGTARRWLSVVGTYPSTGMQLVAVIGVDGLLDVEVLGAGAGVVAVRGGDTGATRDGYTDMMFSYQSDHAIGQLVNVGDPESGPKYSLTLPGAADVVPFGIAGANPNNLAQPAVDDLDNDGDDDTFQAIASTGNFFVYRSPQFEESLAKPWVNPVGSIHMTRGGGQLKLHLDLAHEDTYTEGADTLQVFTYCRPSPTDPVDPNPVDVQTFDLRVPEWVDEDGAMHYSCAIPLVDPPRPGPCTHFDSMYFIVMRTMSSETHQCFPARLYAIQGALDEVNFEFIAEHSPDGEIDFWVDHPCNSVVPNPHGQQGGMPTSPPGGGPLECVWPIPEDQAGSGDELPCLPGPTLGGEPPTGE